MPAANQAVPDDLANQHPEAISAMFGRVAKRYDLMNHAMGAGIDIYWRWKLVRAVRAQRPARVLDLAAGSGDVLLEIQRQKACTEFAAGADFCLPMLRIARSKKATNLLVSDGLRLPFPAAAFDAVTIAFGLRNFVDRLAGLREMRRVLRPGGRAYVLEFSHPVPWFAPAYFGYMCAIMPKYSRLFTTEEGAYQYLGESIKAFPPQPKLAEMMLEAGFSSANWINFALGIVALHVAEV